MKWQAELTTNTNATADHTIPIAGAQRSHGTGRLSVVSIDGATRLKTFYQQGCAKLRVPARIAGQKLEAVMINSAGGMTGGDRLEWEFEAGPETILAATTQACEKVYRSAGGTAETAVTIKAAAKSLFLWLPQETILFDNSAYLRTITADLDRSASALFVESMIFGRRSMGESVKSADVRDRWRIRQNGCLIHSEEFHIGGNVADILGKPGIAGGCTALATIVLIGPDNERHLEAVRNSLGNAGAASAWNGKLVARLAASDGYSLRKSLVPVLQVLIANQSLPKSWAS